MKLYNNDMYMDDVRYVASLNLNWKLFDNKNILLSGATGMIGSFFIDVLMYRRVSCKIFALTRDEIKFSKRFSQYINNSNLKMIVQDINKPILFDIEKIDYVLHLASNTHPLQYATDPIGTITTNIIGAQNMLNFAAKHNCERFLFASSNEIYGENRGDVELFSEEYCGYIDCNTLRAGYPESKRCSEALCQAYAKQKNVDVVIARFTRSYGPTMKFSDTKVISQFIKKAIKEENIILKSSGEQFYSFQYVADSVSGLLFILLLGKSNEAYNIASSDSDIRLKDMAKFFANFSGVNVIYEKPDNLEASGYSKATKARLDGGKLQKLGWIPRYDIYSGIKRTLMILKNCYLSTEL